MFTLVDPNVYTDVPMSGKAYVYCRVVDDNGITMDAPLKHQSANPTEQEILDAANAFVAELNEAQ